MARNFNTKELTIEAIHSRLKALQDEQDYWLEMLEVLLLDESTEPAPAPKGTRKTAKNAHDLGGRKDTGLPASATLFQV